MDRHTTKATTVRLEPQDKDAIAYIKELYGCSSDIAAIKLALRMVARGEILITPAPNKERASYPQCSSTGFYGAV